MHNENAVSALCLHNLHQQAAQSHVLLVLGSFTDIVLIACIMHAPLQNQIKFCFNYNLAAEKILASVYQLNCGHTTGTYRMEIHL
jgi:hypothetical protein